MVSDALVPCVTRPSVAMILTMCNGDVLEFPENKIQITPHFQFQGIV